MQVETCQIGRALRLGENTRIVFHRRQGARVCLGATAPTGTPLLFDGAYISPLSGTAGTSTFLFSLLGIRRFVLGPFDVQVWLPGAIVPLAADCEDWLHVGITHLPESFPPMASNRSVRAPVSPASATSTCPLSRVDGGCRPLFGVA